MCRTGNLARGLWYKFETELKRIVQKVRDGLDRVSDEAQFAGWESERDRFEVLLQKLLSNPSSSRQRPETSSCHCIPYAENPRFVGRNAELETIHQTLSPKAGFRVGAPKTFLLHGMGGMGKSEIALAYAHGRKEVFTTIFWVPAETAQKVQAVFSEFAVALGLEETGSETDLVKIKNSVLWRLNSTGL